MTGDSKQTKMLDKVRKLMAKSDGAAKIGELNEAAAFREAADKLMTAYAIEVWQIEAVSEGKPEPERRDFDTSWFYRNPQADALWQMFHAAARHCRCKVIWWKGTRETRPVLGLPADLDYLDLLFTSLMLQAVNNMEPKPDPSKSVEENGYNLRSKGVSWMRATELMYNAGLIDLPRGRTLYIGADESVRSFRRNVPADTREAMKNALAEKVRRYRRVNSLPDYTAIHPSVYQRSYVWGFVEEIRDRFAKMRNEQRETAKDEGKPFDIVIRGIDQELNDMADEMFGASPKKKGRALGNSAMDLRAYRDGADAGQRARIETSPGARLKSRKELPA